MIPKGKQWSEEETNFLIQNHQKMSIKELSEKFERSTESIRGKLKRHDISASVPTSSKGSLIHKPQIGKANRSSIGAKNAPKRKKKYEMASQDIAKLVPVYIDYKTTIYIKEGKDPQAARERYFARLAERVS